MDLWLNEYINQRVRNEKHFWGKIFMPIILDRLPLVKEKTPSGTLQIAA